MQVSAHCPKCNARGAWFQKIGWDNVNKVWEYGCVLCGWHPPLSARQANGRHEDPHYRPEYARGA